MDFLEALIYDMLASLFLDCLQIEAIDDHDDCKNANLANLTQQLKVKKSPAFIH